MKDVHSLICNVKIFQLNLKINTHFLSWTKILAAFVFLKRLSESLLQPILLFFPLAAVIGQKTEAKIKHLKSFQMRRSNQNECIIENRLCSFHKWK